MRRLKTSAWCPPPVSKNDLGVGTSLVTAEREWDSSFCRYGPFLCACIAPIPVKGLWEFLHISIIILIQFKIFLFSFIPYSLSTQVHPFESSNLPSLTLWNKNPHVLLCEIIFYEFSQHNRSLKKVDVNNTNVLFRIFLRFKFFV